VLLFRLLRNVVDLLPFGYKTFGITAWGFWVEDLSVNQDHPDF
jgi:hypothetical protein